MKIPKIKWTSEPGDGTGCSIKDMEVRNEKGYCGFQKCGNKLGDNPGYWMFGDICEECDKEIKKMLSEWREDL